MFKFTPNLTFWWPVKVIEPNPDAPGKFVEHEFKAQFEMLPPDDAKSAAKERAAIVAKIVPDLSDEQTEAIQSELDEHDRKQVQRVLRNWEGVVDEDNVSIPFNERNFCLVYGYRHIRNAFVRAYMDALSEDKARLGN
ncbi:hypothetical protein [Brucella anthropi]|uniref:hypothetical protein n=1 Tax=Brucella anthropi TaxID=529 RepID=UPI0005B9AC8A|nr:hypothetical protein [Brucella anthropi]KIU69119.1 hypothetical protein TR92_07535 [Brucella anthropi]